MSGIIAVAYTVVLALPMPFTAVHLLFINLLTDSLPAIAISAEKADSDLLNDKPRGRDESIMTKDFYRDITLWGVLIAIFTLISYHIGLTVDPAVASTMAFSTLCLGRLFHGFNCRGRKSIVKLGFMSNKYSVMAFFAGALLLALALLVPPLQTLFQVAPLSANRLALMALLAFAPTLIIQLVRLIKEAVLKSKK